LQSPEKRAEPSLVVGQTGYEGAPGFDVPGHAPQHLVFLKQGTLLRDKGSALRFRRYIPHGQALRMVNEAA
jgi:hypothetical protein